MVFGHPRGRPLPRPPLQLRDTIDILVERDGRRFVLVDTARIRRKTKVLKEDSPVEVAA